MLALHISQVLSFIKFLILWNMHTPYDDEKVGAGHHCHYNNLYMKGGEIIFPANIAGSSYFHPFIQ